MKINDLTPQASKLSRKEHHHVNSPSALKEKGKTGDSLEISSKVKTVEALVTKVLNTLEDSDRVTSIKEQIAAGTYELDSKKLAEKMLKSD